jgi:hypothetical protein
MDKYPVTDGWIIAWTLHGELTMSLPTTHSSGWKLAFPTTVSTNTTNLAGKSLTATKPEGEGIITPGSSVQHNSLVVVPLHDGADTNTLDITFHAYRSISVPAGTVNYIPTLLAHLAVTASALTATMTVGGTSYGFLLPDTITLTAGDSAVHIVSQSTNFGAFAVIDTYGSQFIEVEIDATAGGGSQNCLYSWI